MDSGLKEAAGRNTREGQNHLPPYSTRIVRGVKSTGQNVYAMPCPSCGSGAKHLVLDCRFSPTKGLRRRRVCGDCSFRWTTYEQVALQINNERAAAAEKRLMQLATTTLKRLLSENVTTTS